VKARVALLCVLASAAGAQVAEKANEQYRDPASRHKMAAGLSHESRDARQKPNELIALLGIKPGETVADVGTAGGYMLPFLSAAVGPKGSVYAEDIFPDFIEAARKYATAKGLSNVKFVLGDARNVQLPAEAMDLVLVLDSFHHFDYPEEMMSGIRKSLKADGRLVVVEYHRKENAMGRPGFALEHLRGGEAEFVKEIEGYGFKAVTRRDFIPDVQWIAVFRKQ
jgi:ubiquinone/menaquinone biosynthesis C-methylase UbiE